MFHWNGYYDKSAHKNNQILRFIPVLKSQKRRGTAENKGLFSKCTPCVNLTSLFKKPYRSPTFQNISQWSQSQEKKNIVDGLNYWSTCTQCTQNLNNCEVPKATLQPPSLAFSPAFFFFFLASANRKVTANRKMITKVKFRARKSHGQTGPKKFADDWKTNNNGLPCPAWYVRLGR